jgi:predicted dehydrogenase
MANSIEEAQKMIGAARKNDTLLGVIYMFRFRNEYVHLKRSVETGQLGRITFIRGRMAHGGGFGIKPNDWRYSAEKAGGSFSLLGIHHADLFMWLNGPIKRVCAVSKTLICEIEGDDTMAAIMEFENGSLGIIDTGYNVTAPGNTLVEVYGDRGAVSINQSDRSYRTFINKGERGDVPYVGGKPKDGWDTVSIESLEKLSDKNNYIDHWIDCVLNNKKPVTPGEAGMASLEIILAAYESASTGRWVDLKHQNWG